jgi:hypothetical protein
MQHRLGCLTTAALGILLTACSVTRPVPVAMDAATLRTYLAEHPAENLRVTERSGRRYWVHAPEVRGDSLVGRRGYDLPARPVGVGLEDVAELHTGHFSAGRTGMAVGGALAVTGVALLLVIDDSPPQPVY